MDNENPVLQPQLLPEIITFPAEDLIDGNTAIVPHSQSELGVQINNQFSLEYSKETLKGDGWLKASMGVTERCRVNLNKWFDLYIRKRSLIELMPQKEIQMTASLGDILRMSPKDKAEPPTNTEGSNGVIIPYGSPIDINDTVICKKEFPLPILSDFIKYQSLRALRTDRPSLVVGFDSEWYYPGGDETLPRIMISWQFSCVWDDLLCEFVFIRKTEKHLLTLELALARILDSLGFPNYEKRYLERYGSLCDKKDRHGDYKEIPYLTKIDAINNSAHLYPNMQKVRKFLIGILCLLYLSHYYAILERLMFLR